MQTDNERDKKQYELEVKRLRELHVVYKTLLRNAMHRKERLEDLMQRKISQRWDQAKKAKMVRRLIAATNEMKDALDVVDQAEYKLNQIDAATSTR